MNSATGPDTSRSIVDLVRDLSGDVSRLVRDEIALAKAETERNIGNAVKALGAIAGGLVLALAALLIILQALVIALSNIMPPAWAAILVAIIVGAAGYLLVTKGVDQLKLSSLAPDRTAKNIARDVKLVKEHAR